MDNFEIKQAIKRYVKSDNQLALQLDGYWGTGKTYFIKNEIIAKMYENDSYYIPVYVSLNGLSNVEELNKKISDATFAASMKKYDKLDNGTISKLITMLGNNSNIIMNNFKSLKKIKSLGVNEGSIKKALSKYVNKNNKPIFILDNLERIEDKKLNIKEVIGYISDLLEQDNKMIIISNEKSLNDNDESKSNKETKFNDIKEKIIDKTINYGQDTNDIAIKIIKKKLNDLDIYDELQDWLVKQSKMLIYDIKNFSTDENNKKSINLRILLSIMSNFKEFYEEYINLNYGNHYNHQLIKSAYLATFVTTYIIKENKINQKQIPFYTIHMLNHQNKRIDKLNTNVKSIQDIKTNEQVREDILKTFHNKDAEFDNNIVYSVEIWKLVKYNTFNIKKYEKHIKSIFQPKNTDLDKIQNFSLFDENGLKRLENRIYNDLNKYKALQRILFIYNKFSYLKENSLLFIDIDFKCFKKWILQRISTSFYDELTSIVVEDFRVPNIQDKEFKEAVKRKIEQRKELIMEDREIKVANMVLNNDISVYEEFPNQFEHIPLFKILCRNEFITQFIKSNEYYVNLMKYLNNDILNVVNANDTKYREVYYTDEFLSKLSNIEYRIKDKVMKYNLKELKSMIEKVKEKLKK